MNKENKEKDFRFSKFDAKTLEGEMISFETTTKITKDLENEADKVIIKLGEKKLTIDYSLLLLYCYSIASEEQKFKLSNFYERRVKEIPYNVQIKLTDEDIKNKIATRSLLLPVDELLIYILEQRRLEEEGTVDKVDINKEINNYYDKTKS